ncbi:MAG TPA: PQQ-dependent sugar dehydrogenase, partial [Pyrinomonadaceae bacterium]
MKTHARTHTTAALCCALLLLAACGDWRGRGGPNQSNPTPAAGQASGGGASAPSDARGGFRVETVVGGLEVPWSIVFAPDGRMLFTERTGRVRVYEQGRLRPEPLAVIPDVERGS